MKSLHATALFALAVVAVGCVTRVAPLPPGPGISVPTVTRSEIISSDGLSAHVDRGNGHGGHQPRVTLHADGTQRVLYVGGGRDGAERWWKLMKRPTGGSWSLEAQGQTNNEALLVRDPTTDLAHVISWPGDRPHVSSAPSFSAAPIPGAWQPQGSPYVGAGIGEDGTLVLITYYDQMLDGTYSKDCERHWASAKWNGSAWAWTPVQKKYIGLRRSYAYVHVAPFGTAGEAAWTSMYNGLKEHWAPNVTGPYVWDNTVLERASVNSTSHTMTDMLPRRNSSSATGEASFMGFQDSIADSKGRILTLTNVRDSRGRSATYLDVFGAGGRIHQSQLTQWNVTGGGNPRLYEDDKHRLWLIEFHGDRDSRVFRINDDFALTQVGALRFSHRYEGFGRIAVPRGGNARGLTIAGAFPSGPHMVAFQIRLPS